MTHVNASSEAIFYFQNLCDYTPTSWTDRRADVSGGVWCLLMREIRPYVQGDLYATWAHTPLIGDQ